MLHSWCRAPTYRISLLRDQKIGVVNLFKLQLDRLGKRFRHIVRGLLAKLHQLCQFPPLLGLCFEPRQSTTPKERASVSRSIDVSIDVSSTRYLGRNVRCSSLSSQSFCHDLLPEIDHHRVGVAVDYFGARILFHHEVLGMLYHFAPKGRNARAYFQTGELADGRS